MSECKYCNMRADDNIKLCKEIDKLEDQLTEKDKHIKELESANFKLASDEANYRENYELLLKEHKTLISKLESEK